MPFQWLTYADALSQLSNRLADPTNLFWTQAELGFYLAEALRTWNALTEQFNVPFQFVVNPAVDWYDTSILPGSPRTRTITDDYLYTLMQYHLLEPPTGGGTWEGTSQYSLTDLQVALERSRDEMIQVTGCNVQLVENIPSLPNVRRTAFPDNTLQPSRVRFIPASAFLGPVTMTREDTLAWDSFQTDHLQMTGIPQAWTVIAGQPLEMEVDVPPNQAGYYDAVILAAGNKFSPPFQTLISVPDDWSYLSVWGALGDLFGRESEATDRQRSAYCQKRYYTGLQVMLNSNWLISATLDGVVVDTPSLREMDGFSPEWQEDPLAYPSVVLAGTDFLGVSPGTEFFAVGATLVANAPVPVNAGDFVQISRDAWDVVLDEAQFLAALKQGGAEFNDSQPLDQNFFAFAGETNKRLERLAIYRDFLGLEGRRQDIEQPR